MSDKPCLTVALVLEVDIGTLVELLTTLLKSDVVMEADKVSGNNSDCIRQGKTYDVTVGEVLNRR
ncbi:hypothetical protein [Marinomonas sp. IMCC 4694]|uniref:hypothetical protein n=1 Tax=Marinomonas sp. IMCC 4694 TaxID=2605432 RepID=UPI0011E6C09E|nr:hypothetical protein [Marinomonas sp. IMCC 4694]TYL47965.1 hypothetical protein FXV75_08500 [Marinomonas sp. IMCC 4694]